MKTDFARNFGHIDIFSHPHFLTKLLLLLKIKYFRIMDLLQVGSLLINESSSFQANEYSSVWVVSSIGLAFHGKSSLSAFPSQNTSLKASFRRVSIESYRKRSLRKHWRERFRRRYSTRARYVTAILGKYYQKLRHSFRRTVAQKQNSASLPICIAKYRTTASFITISYPNYGA